MTINYALSIATVTPGNFAKLILRWKASLWKAVIFELLVWSFCYLGIALAYHSNMLLRESEKIFFEDMVVAIHHRLLSKLEYIPVAFVLGFFVSVIVERWDVMINNMGYIENVSLCIANYIKGSDEDTRLLRRTLCRWMCLSQILVYRDIAISVRKRFATLDSLVQAGILMEHEQKALEACKLHYNKYWMPIHWVTGKVVQLRREEKIQTDMYVTRINRAAYAFRDNLAQLCRFDWVPVPLAYTQLVVFAVNIYFILCLLSRQFIVTDREIAYKGEIDFWIPIMTVLQFIFLVAWLKVAESLLNPFGEDDDDFEGNFLIDKNFATCLRIADDTPNPNRPILRDRFWHQRIVEALYPKSSRAASGHSLIGSAVSANIEKYEGSEMVAFRNVILQTASQKNQNRSKSMGTSAARPPSPILPPSENNARSVFAVTLQVPMEKCGEPNSDQAHQDAQKLAIAVNRLSQNLSTTSGQSTSTIGTKAFGGRQVPFEVEDETK